MAVVLPVEGDGVWERPGDVHVDHGQELDPLVLLDLGRQRVGTLAALRTRGEPFAPTDLEAVVADVLSDLEVRVEEVGGTVDVGPLPTVEVDPTQMRQLFQNLIGNALKFHREDVRPVVVVSALGGLTDQLIAALEAAAARTGEHEALLDQIRERHFEVLHAVVSEDEHYEVRAQLESHLQTLHDLLGGVYLLREATPRTRDALIGLGELMNAPLAAAVEAAPVRSLAYRYFSIHTLDDWPEMRARATNALIRMLQEGAIKVPIYDRIPLAEAPRAHRVFESGQVMGKLIMKP
mgnify:CR=1 FL=1